MTLLLQIRIGRTSRWNTTEPIKMSASESEPSYSLCSCCCWLSDCPTRPCRGCHRQNISRRWGPPPCSSSIHSLPSVSRLSPAVAIVTRTRRCRGATEHDTQTGGSIAGGFVGRDGGCSIVFTAEGREQLSDMRKTREIMLALTNEIQLHAVCHISIENIELLGIPQLDGNTALIEASIN